MSSPYSLTSGPSGGELPPDYIGLKLSDRQKYVQRLQKEVSDLQETLETLKSESSCNYLSSNKHLVVPFPPQVRFKPTRRIRSVLKSKVVAMNSFQQQRDYPSLCTVTQSGTVVLWDAETGLKYETFHIGKGSTMAIAANKDGSVIITGGMSCFVEVYKIAENLREFTSAEKGVDLGPDYTASRHSLSHRASQYRYSLSGHDAAISSVCFFDDTNAVSAGHDHTVLLWDVVAAKSTNAIHEAAPINSIDTNGSILFASGAQDGILKVWDIRDRTGLPVRMNSPGPITIVKFMPDGNTVLACTQNTLHLFDLRTNMELENYILRMGSITSMDISDSGRLAVVGTNSGAVLPLDLFQNRWLSPIDRRKDRISGIAVLGDTVFSSSWDGSVRSYQYVQ